MSFGTNIPKNTKLKDSFDFKTFKLLINFQKFFFNVPLLCVKWRVFRILYKAICLVLFILEIPKCIMLIIGLDRFYDSDKGSYFVRLAGIVVGSCFILIKTKTVLFNKPDWERLYQQIKEIDSILDKSNFKPYYDKNFHLKWISRCFVVVVAASIIWNVSCILEDSTCDLLQFLMMRINFMILISTYEAIVGSMCVKIRYNFMKQMVTEILYARYPPTLKTKKIHNLSKLVRRVWEMVQTSNYTFGSAVFIGIIWSILDVLTMALAWLSDINDHSGTCDSCKIIWSYLSTFSLVLTLTLMIQCQSMEAASDNFSNKCHLSRKVVQDNKGLSQELARELDQELLYVAEYTKHYRPQFFALFLTINQDLLASVASFIITYLIVIMQSKNIR